MLPGLQDPVRPTDEQFSALPGEDLILLGTHDNYIHSALFDPINKTLRCGRSNKTEPHPSWLVRHPHLPDIVYSNSWAEGKIFVLRLNGPSGDLEELDSIKTGGKGLNHMAVIPDGSAIIGAHYGSGSAAHILLAPDGMFRPGPFTSEFHLPSSSISMKHPRQDGPHAHQIVCHGKEVLIPDLGTNSVLRAISPKVGGHWVCKGAVREYQPDDGPRHVVVHPKGTHLYTLCELSSTLVCHTLPPIPEKLDVSKEGSPILSIPDQSGAPLCISRHSILPPADRDNQDKMLASEIILLPSLHPSGKHLLICTNRDSPNPEGDAIALFSVDNDGTIERTEQGWVTGVGKHLRGMAGDKEGRYVAVAGRDGGGLVIFERDWEKGLTLNEVAYLEVDQVVCPLWID